MTLLEKAFNTVMSNTACTYRDVTIEIWGTQFKVYGKMYDSRDDAEKTIDSSYTSLASSIKRCNGLLDINGVL